MSVRGFDFASSCITKSTEYPVVVIFRIRSLTMLFCKNNLTFTLHNGTGYYNFSEGSQFASWKFLHEVYRHDL